MLIIKVFVLDINLYSAVSSIYFIHCSVYIPFVNYVVTGNKEYIEMSCSTSLCFLCASM